jgi:glutathione-specific gamma-glutamylcyclotransferase
MADTWFFAYGSLIWNPGFQPVQALPARLTGWQRRFCMSSIHYRGTAEAPGLVLALDRAEGARCDGLALCPAPSEAAEVAARIRARELISDAYLEVTLPVTLADGRAVQAITYVIDRQGGQFCDHCVEDQAAIIARAAGIAGPNRDYLFNTAAHLHALGIADPHLDDLAARVRALTPA